MAKILPERLRQWHNGSATLSTIFKIISTVVLWNTMLSSLQVFALFPPVLHHCPLLVMPVHRRSPTASTLYAYVYAHWANRSICLMKVINNTMHFITSWHMSNCQSSMAVQWSYLLNILACWICLMPAGCAYTFGASLCVHPYVDCSYGNLL